MHGLVVAVLTCDAGPQLELEQAHVSDLDLGLVPVLHQHIVCLDVKEDYTAPVQLLQPLWQQQQQQQQRQGRAAAVAAQGRQQQQWSHRTDAQTLHN
jgi:hypothetical protein